MTDPSDLMSMSPFEACAALGHPAYAEHPETGDIYCHCGRIVGHERDEIRDRCAETGHALHPDPDHGVRRCYCGRRTDADLGPLPAITPIHTDPDGRHYDDAGRTYTAVTVDGELTYQLVED